MESLHSQLYMATEDTDRYQKSSMIRFVFLRLMYLKAESKPSRTQMRVSGRRLQMQR